MKIEKLELVKPAIDFLTSEGFEKLYPPQTDCIKAGLLNGQSILVSAPTASGKTLIAILAMISYLSKNNGKIIYLSPLRALAAEKFTEFKKLEKIPLGKKIKVGISTGDFENIDAAHPAVQLPEAEAAHRPGRRRVWGRDRHRHARGHPRGDRR